MAMGRCAGCGKTDASRKVQLHALTCPEYLDLYRTDPVRCLDPDAEYARYQAEDNNPEARAERRDIRLRRRFLDTEQANARQAARWATPKDLLDD